MQRLFLPVKEDRLDQGDNIPAGVVSCTDNSHMDGLREKEKRRWNIIQIEAGLPAL